jgi:hypothetical protein
MKVVHHIGPGEGMASGDSGGKNHPISIQVNGLSSKSACAQVKGDAQSCHLISLEVFIGNDLKFYVKFL